MGATAESLGNVAAHRVDGVFGLALKLEISVERLAPCELEDCDADFVSQLPDDQIRVVPRGCHEDTDRTPDATKSSAGISARCGERTQQRHHHPRQTYAESATRLRISTGLRE